MTYFYDQSEPPRRELAPGINARIFWGDKVMMSLVEIAPNSKMPVHSHPNEQAGMVMQGEFDFTIGGQTKRMRQGDVYVIPGRCGARSGRLRQFLAGPGYLQPTQGGVQTVVRGRIGLELLYPAGLFRLHPNAAGRGATPKVDPRDKKREALNGAPLLIFGGLGGPRCRTGRRPPGRCR